jgi:hypothetical protein
MQYTDSTPTPHYPSETVPRDGDGLFVAMGNHPFLVVLLLAIIVGVCIMVMRFARWSREKAEKERASLAPPKPEKPSGPLRNPMLEQRAKMVRELAGSGLCIMPGCGEDASQPGYRIRYTQDDKKRRAAEQVGSQQLRRRCVARTTENELCDIHGMLGEAKVERFVAGLNSEDAVHEEAQAKQVMEFERVTFFDELAADHRVAAGKAKSSLMPVAPVDKAAEKPPESNVVNLRPTGSGESEG